MSSSSSRVVGRLSEKKNSFLVEAIFIIVIVYFSQVHLRIILSDRDLPYFLVRDTQLYCVQMKVAALCGTLAASLLVGAN